MLPEESGGRPCTSWQLFRGPRRHTGWLGSFLTSLAPAFVVCTSQSAREKTLAEQGRIAEKHMSRDCKERWRAKFIVDCG